MVTTVGDTIVKIALALHRPLSWPEHVRDAALIAAWDDSTIATDDGRRFVATSNICGTSLDGRGGVRRGRQLASIDPIIQNRARVVVACGHAIDLPVVEQPAEILRSLRRIGQEQHRAIRNLVHHHVQVVCGR
eukprot:6195738-Prymnesium_polylepis.1